MKAGSVFKVKEPPTEPAFGIEIPYTFAELA